MAARRTALVVLSILACARVTPIAWAADHVNAGTDSAVQLTVPNPEDAFTVAILGDRTGGDDSGLAVLDRAVREINELAPDFVLHVGDLVPGYTRDMVKWERDIDRFQDIIGGLECPFYPLPGNHDVITGTGNPMDRRGEELYKKHFGPLYYSFDYRYAHFVCLYTDEALQSAPHFSQEQIDWLREDLAKTQARHIFIIMHKPVWEYASGNWSDVEEMLKGHPVRAVFAGHFHHYYKSQKRGGIQYYVLGVTGGQTFSPELAGGLEHYCLLRITPDGYRLALVKPGSVQADDYITEADFKAMEKLRFLSRDKAGVASPVRSPELGDVDEQVTVTVSNPLDVPLPVTVRGVSLGGWRFSPETRSMMLAPGTQRDVRLGIRCARVSADDLVVPEVQIQYTYVDTKDRTVSIVLRRRVPLRRAITVPPENGAASLDGKAEEPMWGRAARLTTARWVVSAYESDEPGPVFRVVPTETGVYFYAESSDTQVSDFRGPRILSDTLFLGVLSVQDAVSSADLRQVPVVVIYPFCPPGANQAVRAFWDARSPTGPPVHGVHVASRRKADGAGWTCEGFAPWEILLSGEAQPRAEVAFNIGAWDNDGELFTELHAWAPTETAALWGRMILEETTGD